MISYLEKYGADMLEYGRFLARAFPEPREEVRYRATQDSGYKRSLKYLVLALFFSALFSAVSFGQDFSDVAFLINSVVSSAVLLVVCYFGLSIAWKLFRYPSDLALLLRAGIYFGTLVLPVFTFINIAYFGYLKIAEPAFYQDLLRVIENYDMTLQMRKALYFELLDKVDSIGWPNAAYAIAALATIFYFGTASILLYFRLHPMGVLKRIAMTLSALVVILILMIPASLFLVGLDSVSSC